MTNEIIEYMTEQYPDLIDAYRDSNSEYLEGIVDAYQHILEKFPYEPLDKNPKT